MIVKRGDMFYADLSPVVGSEQGGIRPVLVIQNNTGNKYSPTMIENAKKVGVNQMILTGTSLAVTRKSFEAVKKYKGTFYMTAGVHPHNASEWNDKVKTEIESLLKEDAVVAVGECGLDYDRNFSTKEQQLYAFEEQIKLAIKYKKPIFLHERDAHEDFVKMLNKYPEVLKQAVVHCFTSNRQIMSVYLKMGMMIGITGWVADDRRGKSLQEAVKELPLDRLMIETDAPFLTPKNMPNYDRNNEPKNLPFVVKKLSELLKVSEEEIIEKTKENTIKFFGLKI